ncbi:MAG: hypothetical protein JSV43_03340 [Methanobacteriota archaeon]|nr:MAG: hypothetical protein JSV43_03340 [Euryarchaeota archaeon]
MKELGEDSPHLESKYSRKTWIVIGTVTVVLAILCIAVMIILVETRPAPSPPQILDVYVSPEHPTSSDEIIVTAHVVSESSSYVSVRIRYCSYFDGSGSGGRGMLSVGNDLYAARLTEHGRIFRDGTEVWFVVTASIGYGETVISESFTFQVGDVLRNGSSGLNILQVAHNPEEPTSEDSVFVTASVYSNAEISHVTLGYMQIRSLGGGGGGGSMRYQSGDNYSGDIRGHGPGGLMEVGFVEGTVILYRVAAKDETGNTAVSNVYTFTIS